ncbi:MAG: thioredoxin family protein [Planctomycetota bacterium]|jgi:peroxiredoxin
MNKTYHRTILIASLVVLIVAGITIADCGTKGCGKKEACCDKKPCTCEKAPKDAPDFKLTDINGKTVQLSKLKGKIVVLEWANYDCPFVKAHYKEGVETTKKLVKKYDKQKVVWLTINSTHYASAEDNKQWAADHKLKHTILIDQDGTVGKAYGAKTTPHVFVIDKDGHIAYQGAFDNAPLGKKPEKEDLVNYADQAVNELLAGKPASVPKTKPYGCSVKYAKAEK